MPIDSIVSEVVIQKRKEIRLARVLTRFDLPGHRYPHGGVWSYLIPTPRGIVVFDAGPYYRSPLGLKSKKTYNTERIFKALELYFPERPISEILISHYHFDHLQNAPNLQKEAFRKFGILPPIRLHAYDLCGKKLLKLIPTNVYKVARRTGHPDALFGRRVIDGERIVGTDFVIIHAPGHTSGNIALVNHKEKLIIAGWGSGKYPNGLAKLSTNFIDEAPELLPMTVKKLNFPDYRYLYYHKM